MSKASFTWGDREIGFQPGESIAIALMRAGEADLGLDGGGSQLRYFCGIGSCQNCLVRVDGLIVESCLTPAVAGMRVDNAGDTHG